MSALASIEAPELDCEYLESQLLGKTQAAAEFQHVETQLTHHFAPGVYMRELLIPVGPNGEPVIAIGHRHLTTHQCCVLAGSGLVNIEGHTRELRAGDVFLVQAGTRKAVIVLDTMRFMCIHPNPDDEQDVEKLESRFVAKSDTYLRMQETPQISKEANL